MRLVTKVLVLFLVWEVRCDDCAGRECLEQYVARPEPRYRWEDLGLRLEADTWTGYILNMTSQQWLSPHLVSRSLWWHQLVVIVPHQVEVTDTALLWVSGMDNIEDADENIDINNYDIELMSNLAVTNGLVAAVLYQVPNQPITFAEDALQEERREDGIVSFTWWHYLQDDSSDTEYLLRLPMTKATVKAMDTINYFLTDDTAPDELQGLGLDPSKFIVGGQSKRGWTAWTTATVEPRVVGIIPLVMDELNFVKNIKHHWQSYGGWTFVFSDYWKLNITSKWDEPKMQEIFDIVDAFESRDGMLMPKLVITAANDEFFLPTDTRYWWQEMPRHEELNRLMILPNSCHGCIEELTARHGVMFSDIELFLLSSFHNSQTI